MKKITYLALFLAVVFLSGCSPEVGSSKWCEAMYNTPKGEWSANDASEYAKSCIFRSKD